MGFPDSLDGKESAWNAGERPQFESWVRKIPWIDDPLQYSWAFLVTQPVKDPPAVWEARVRAPGWVATLEKGKAVLLPVFWPREFHGLYSPWHRKESDTTERRSFSLHFFHHLL